MLGGHIPRDNIKRGIKEVREAGGDIVQIFLTPHLSRVTEWDLDLDIFQKNKMGVVVHSSYMHNIARDWDSHSWWIRNIIDELELCQKIGSVGLVLHFGKQKELSMTQAYNNMFTSLVHIVKKTKGNKVPILLETAAGEGTQLCYKLDDLAYFYKKISRHPTLSERIKLCLDSCHIFTAGYPLNTKEQVKLYLESFDELIGFHHVGLIHLNDCKVPVGSRRDRHENIDKGYIGALGLRLFFKFFNKRGVPVILETPYGDFKREFKLLKK